VSGSVGFRNDIIIRGGAPNENVYYLDQVEIPNINHFATQGSAGGPVGMLNVSFIEDVTLNTSAFSPRYDNPLSGVLQFKQRNGNQERRQGNFRLSATEVAATLEGPVIRNNPNTTFIASVRRSYLQFLFKFLELPFLPDYWDYQYKVTHKMNDKNEISLIGLGSIDNFKLNSPGEKKADETQGDYLARLAIIDQLPLNSQWSTTAGITWKRRIENGYFNVTLSKNVLHNQAEKYENDDKNQPARFLYKSTEDENKLRFDLTQFYGNWTVSYGANLQYSQYSNSTFNRIRNEITDEQGNVISPAFTVDYRTNLNFWKGGAFTQVSRSFLDNRLTTTAGIRTDVNTFNNQGANPLQTLSPRLALSYSLSNQWNINASVGRYYKIPPYTVLGFRQPETNSLVNKDAKYIRSDHLVAGLEYLPARSTRITVEGFYKKYANYPVSTFDSISLANLGGNFGILGNERVAPVGLGRTYGVEFLFQQKLTRNFYGILSYTLYWSEYTGFNPSQYIPSAWDNRHLISFTGGYKLGRNWEVGVRFRLLGGSPYTPVDSAATLQNYDITGSSIPDYSKLNTLRLKAYNAADIRIDKKWNFKRWTLDIYLELQNAYNSQNPSAPSYTLERNDDNTIRQPRALYGLPQDNSSILPTIGLIVEL
jgi:hypothetical protein